MSQWEGAVHIQSIAFHPCPPKAHSQQNTASSTVRISLSLIWFKSQYSKVQSSTSLQGQLLIVSPWIIIRDLHYPVYQSCHSVSWSFALSCVTWSQKSNWGGEGMKEGWTHRHMYREAGMSWAAVSLLEQHQLYSKQPGTWACLLCTTQGEELASLSRRCLGGKQSPVVAVREEQTGC